jgi:glycosyltransferase involved in cell wall biosynthesis
MVINEKENPFNIISQESLNYDIFINANMLTKVNPRSIVSIFVCHFPDRDKEMFFQVDKYDYIFTNSKYTSFWLKKRWGLKSDLLLYPHVDMFSITEQMPHKEKIILSVARFEIGGTKKQLEMIQVFKELCTNEPQISKEWKLVLAGGAVPDSPYFEKIKREIASCQFENILLKPNLTHSELKKQYQEASIFWHACGLGETSPHLIEHFGMTTVEAMQNFCVPIVIDGGGQREIVDHQINGFRFKTLDEMKYFTLSLINDENLRKKLAQSAFDKSKFYTYEMFKQEVTDFFRYIKKRIMGGELLEVMM